jgi:hypothetical protein
MARSKYAAGMRRVNVPLSPPLVDEERTDPRLAIAIRVTSAERDEKLPSSIERATSASRMIFERSVDGAAGPLPCWTSRFVNPASPPLAWNQLDRAQSRPC